MRGTEMNIDKLKLAEAEAKRFLARCVDYRKAIAANPDHYTWPRESGATKRASLDLTRALADLRKPQS